uniref:Putative PD-(D/E)XK nuclease superfamily protein n=1 Tax=viral metagenome TaxID=1070528 RepID=A0A6M3LM99_9ZZZZ
MLKEQSILYGSAHWYDGETGEPRYEIPCKGDPSKMRRPNLRDARELGLVKSVTSIIKEMVPAPGLVNWQMRQLFNASQAATRLDGETDDDYFTRLCNLAADEATLTADVGTRTHNAIEKFVSTGQTRFEDDVQPLFENYFIWHNEHIGSVLESEGYIPPDKGYGGRFDLLAETICGDTVSGPALIDVKTKKTVPNKPVFRADEYGLQLAAYAYAKDLHENYKLWILIISTTETGRIEVVDFTDERDRYSRWFTCLFDAWCLKNKLEVQL